MVGFPGNIKSKVIGTLVFFVNFTCQRDDELRVQWPYRSRYQLGVSRAA